MNDAYLHRRTYDRLNALNHQPFVFSKLKFHEASEWLCGMISDSLLHKN
jgi:hypothetical protein